MKLILMAFVAVFVGGTSAVLADPVSLAEAGKVMTALKAWNCVGGKIEKDTDEDDKLTYEVEAATCRDGQFDFTLDKDFKVVQMSRTE